MHARSRPDARVALLSTAVLLEAAGIGALFPLLARVQAADHLPTAGLGVMSAAAFFSAVVSQLALARHLDGRRARAVLLGAVALGALAQLWFALGTELWELTASRALGGLGIGVVLPAALKAATDGVAADERGGRLGRISSMQMVGIVLGPLVGVGLDAVGGLRAPFLTLAGLGIVLTALLARVTATPAGPRPRRPGAPTDGSTTGRPVPPVDLPTPAGLSPPDPSPPAGGGRPSPLGRPVLAVLLLSAALQLPAGLYDALWSRLLTDRGAATALIGASLAAFGLPYALLAPLGGRLAALRPLRWSSAALLVAACFMATYGYVGSPVVITVLGMFEACAQAIAGPGAYAATAAAFPDRWSATGQGWASAAGTGAAGLAALAGAPLYAAAGPGIVFAAGAAVSASTVAASLAVARGRRPRRRRRPVAGVGSGRSA